MATALKRRRRKKKFRSSKGRKYGALTDRAILQMVRNGTLIVDVDAGRVYTTIKTKGADRREVAQVYDKKGRYLFVTIYRNNRRKKIAVHKIVWMKANNRAVPDGFEVHHQDSDSEHNTIDNLGLWDALGHRSHNGKKSQALAHGEEWPAEWDEIEADENVQDEATFDDVCDLD